MKEPVLGHSPLEKYEIKERRRKNLSGGSNSGHLVQKSDALPLELPLRPISFGLNMDPEKYSGLDSSLPLP